MISLSTSKVVFPIPSLGVGTTQRSSSVQGRFCSAFVFLGDSRPRKNTRTTRALKRDGSCSPCVFLRDLTLRGSSTVEVFCGPLAPAHQTIPTPKTSPGKGIFLEDGPPKEVDSWSPKNSFFSLPPCTVSLRCPWCRDETNECHSDHPFRLKGFNQFASPFIF